MRTFSFISLSITLALAFILWLPNEWSFPIIWLSFFFLPILLIADLVALIYLIRHRKEKVAKWLAGLVVAIPLTVTIGYYAPWLSTSDKTMSAHFHKHEKELRELVTYAESLSDSVSLKIPSKPKPENVSEEDYQHTLRLLKKAHCKRIETYNGFGQNTLIHFRGSGFATNGYTFYPDGTVKIFRWDPLGSDWSGTYDLLP
jgi:hypothetical protein